MKGFFAQKGMHVCSLGSVFGMRRTAARQASAWQVTL